MKESAYQTKVLKYLKERGGYYENIWGGGFQASGIPDIIGCYRGVFVGFELKVGKNKPSKIQEIKVRKINESGGKAIIAYDTLEPIIELLDQIDMEKDGYENERI